MIRLPAIIVCLLLCHTGCMTAPCLDAGPGLTESPSQNRLSRFKASCAGMFNLRAPCIPRRYFSISGYDAFLDRIVVRDAATCNARRAYRQFRRGSGGVYSVDFRDGFCSAYLNYAEGFPTDTPPLPPRKYWSAHYRTPQGHERAAEWFTGYEAGMACVQADPTGEYNIVPADTVLEHEGLRAAHHNFPPVGPYVPNYGPDPGYGH